MIGLATLLVGVSTLTSEVPGAYEILRHVKGRCDVPVVMGGWHCTLFPQQTAACKFVDYVIAGEGDRHQHGHRPDDSAPHRHGCSAGCDLDRDHVVGDGHHLAVDAAGGQHVVAALDALIVVLTVSGLRPGA